MEINNSFYHLPSLATFEAWRRQAPAGFVYAVKANRFITHIRRLRDAKEPLERFFAGARGLGQALGPILYQLLPTGTSISPALQASSIAFPLATLMWSSFDTRAGSPKRFSR